MAWYDLLSAYGSASHNTVTIFPVLLRRICIVEKGKQNGTQIEGNDNKADGLSSSNLC